MKLSLYTNKLLAAPVDLLAVGVFSDEPDRGIAFSQLNRALSGSLDKACRDEKFEGKLGQTIIYNVQEDLSAKRILIFGYGARSEYGLRRARRFAATVAGVARKTGADSCALTLTITEVPADPQKVYSAMQGLAEGVIHGSYQFTKYKSKSDSSHKLKEAKIAFSADDVRGMNGAMLRDALAKGRIIAESANTTRDLVNEPANHLYPAKLGDFAKSLAKKFELDFKQLNPRDLEKQGMNLLLGVGGGSSREPKLIHLLYKPEKKLSKGAPVIALVGKGLTYDSGGLSLKPTDSMVNMKNDMGGAAVVLGAMQAIAGLQPDCVVHGIIPAAENMPDGNSIRPGDVIRSKSGLTVEVMNTDAEGRLVLADAIAYALEQKPTDIMDFATLTGACLVALGPSTAGAYASSETMAQDIKDAWIKTGEKFWPMPLDSDLREQLKSDIADIKNLGEKWGGSITAALFLQAFVGNGFPRWAHFDIAGPVMHGNEQIFQAKGATGFGVATCVEYILKRVAEKAD